MPRIAQYNTAARDKPQSSRFVYDRLWLRRSKVALVLQLIELAVKDGVSNVLKTFDGVERLNPAQSDGIFNFVRRKVGRRSEFSSGREKKTSGTQGTKSFACKSFRNNVRRFATQLKMVRYNLQKPEKPFRVNIAKSTYAALLRVSDFL